MPTRKCSAHAHDESRSGGVRKVVDRNHQVLGVNNAVASVLRQERLKQDFPPGTRLQYRTATVPPEELEDETADARALGSAMPRGRSSVSTTLTPASRQIR